MDQGDYYQILAVDKNASAQKVKEAYRKLALQYHPDRNKDNPVAVERMKEINEAYAVLSDSRKRRDYDALQQQYGPYGYDRFRQTYTDEDIFRGSDINQIFAEMARAFGLRDFEEVFRESYGEGYRTFEFRRPGVFGRGFIFFGPGTRRTSRVESPQPFGRITQLLLKRMFKLHPSPFPSPLGGEGRVRGRDFHERVILPREAREGGKVRYFHAKRSKELVITVPPGIREGQRIKLKGMGGEGREGGEPGDLYLEVTFQKPLLQKVVEYLKAVIARFLGP